MCLDAMKSDGSALFYVADELRTSEICCTAVRSNLTAMSWVPAPVLKPDFVLDCLHLNPYAILYASHEVIPKALALEMDLAWIRQMSAYMKTLRPAVTASRLPLVDAVIHEREMQAVIGADQGATNTKSAAPGAGELTLSRRRGVRV